MFVLTMLTVFITVFCFLNVVGSEEFVSELNVKLKQRENDDILYTSDHENYRSYPRGPPPHTHHSHEAGFEPRYHNPYYPQAAVDSYGPPHFPPDFQHNPEFHAQNSGPKNGIRGDKKLGDYPKNEVNFKNNTNSSKIPLDFLQELDKYEVNDLLVNYVDGYQEDEDQTPLFSNRFGEGQMRSAAVVPAKAHCTPELTTIPLASSEDPTIVYIPKCTKIQRCSGCCSSELLTCQPVETETIPVQVYKTQYEGGKKLKFLGKEIIPVEKHTKCKCDCKQCNPHQVYSGNECSCICTNTDEERKCYKDSKKEWDLETCRCKCQGLTECSTGAYYDHNDCICKRLRRRNARYDRTKYSSNDLYVNPLVV